MQLQTENQLKTDTSEIYYTSACHGAYVFI